MKRTRTDLRNNLQNTPQQNSPHCNACLACFFSFKASEGSCPVYLFSLEYVSCVDNSIVTSSTGDLTGKAVYIIDSSLQNRRYFVAFLGKPGQARGGHAVTETRHEREAITLFRFPCLTFHARQHPPHTCPCSPERRQKITPVQ